MKQFRSKSLLLLISAVLAAGTANGQSQKLSQDLEQLIGQTLEPVNVIIQFKTAPTILDLAALDLVGALITRTYSVIPAVAVTLPASKILGLLLSLTDITYITPDRSVLPLLDITAPALGANTVWQTGAGRDGDRHRGHR